MAADSVHRPGRVIVYDHNTYTGGYASTDCDLRTYDRLLTTGNTYCTDGSDGGGLGNDHAGRDANRSGTL